MRSPAPARALGLLVALAVVAGNAAFVATRLGPPLHRPRQVLESDHWHYLEMARVYAAQLAPGERSSEARPELASRAPYCWRVLVPGLVALSMRLGVSIHLAFWLLTNVALVGFLFVLFLWLEDLGFDLRLRLVGLLLAGLLPGAVRWFEYQYWMTDPLGLLLTALGVRLAAGLEGPEHARRARQLVLLGLVSALTRETFVLVYPYAFFVLRRRLGTARALGATALLAAGPLALALLLRASITPAIHPGLIDSIADNLAFRLNHLGDNQLYVLTLGTWGVLLPLLLLSPRACARRLRERPEDLALIFVVYATTLLISNNNDRPLSYALPAVLPLALAGLRALLAVARRPGALILGVTLVVQGSVYVATPFTGQGISVYQPTNWWVVALLAAFTLGATWRLRTRAGAARAATRSP